MGMLHRHKLKVLAEQAKKEAEEKSPAPFMNEPVIDESVKDEVPPVKKRVRKPKK